MNQPDRSGFWLRLAALMARAGGGQSSSDLHPPLICIPPPPLKQSDAGNG